MTSGSGVGAAFDGIVESTTAPSQSIISTMSPVVSKEARRTSTRAM
jgi:hypothetical protein